MMTTFAQLIQPTMAPSTLQLLVVIAFPILVNAIFTATLFLLLSNSFNSRISDLRSEMNARFEAIDRRFEALEKLIDARFESLEREIHSGEGS